MDDGADVAGNSPRRWCFIVMMIGVGVSMDGRRMRTIDIMARCMNMAEREGELKKQRQQRQDAAKPPVCPDPPH